MEERITWIMAHYDIVKGLGGFEQGMLAVTLFIVGISLAGIHDNIVKGMR